MQETTFYFVRHGETDCNRERIMQGRRINSPLNDTGRRQAEALAGRLADVEIDAIYTSELRRAIETADHLAVNHTSVPRYSLGDLDEMSWGVHEGRPWSDELAALLNEMFGRWDRGEFDYRVEEGESIRDVQERGVRAVEHLIGRHAGETLLVVTHGRFLRVLLATILDVGLARMNEFDHANTCVNLITYRNGTFTPSLLNCTAHLGDAVSVLVE